MQESFSSRSSGTYSGSSNLNLISLIPSNWAVLISSSLRLREVVNMRILKIRVASRNRIYWRRIIGVFLDNVKLRMQGETFCWRFVGVVKSRWWIIVVSTGHSHDQNLQCPDLRYLPGLDLRSLTPPTEIRTFWFDSFRSSRSAARAPTTQEEVRS